MSRIISRLLLFSTWNRREKRKQMEAQVVWRRDKSIESRRWVNCSANIEKFIDGRSNSLGHDEFPVQGAVKAFSARFNYTAVFQGCKIAGLKGTYFHTHTKIPGETSLRTFPVCCLPACSRYSVHNSIWNVLFQLCENWRHWGGGTEFISQLVCGKQDWTLSVGD